MKKVLFALILAAGAAFSLQNCKSAEQTDPLAGVRPTLPDVPHNYASFVGPDGRSNFGKSPQVATGSGFGSPIIGTTPGNPTITDAGATLGRVLFYDKRMSVTNTVACASCHKQEFAFSDGVKASDGINGQVTSRNSNPITNVGYKNFLFWDSRATNIIEVVEQPVSNHIEMGMENLDQVAIKLKSVDFYPELFKKAFGDDKITKERISSAVGQFACSIVSSNSKYDAEAKTDFVNFTPQEQLGKELFFDAQKANCEFCHKAPTFGAPDNPTVGYYGGPSQRGSANIGLKMKYDDNGVNSGQFCIPSLRNIALTAPYMHDGSLATLQEVVDHYNEKVEAHPNLDINLKVGFSGAPKKLNLTAEEKEALIAFLHTLTDRSILTDEKFSDPFN